jgi:hypothetical protein
VLARLYGCKKALLTAGKPKPFGLFVVIRVWLFNLAVSNQTLYESSEGRMPLSFPDILTGY